MKQQRSIVQANGEGSTQDRVSGLNWKAIESELQEHGCAVLGQVLSKSECSALIATYDSETAFRSRVIMARHGFGKGEYKYYKYPLPETIFRLRTDLYPQLAEIANNWEEALGGERRFPSSHDAYLRQCHKGGQSLPTPLILKYGEGDYNCLHRDLYGEMVFPLQVTILLSAPGEDFRGGDFVLTEQRPRMQSRVEVVPLRQGEAVVFAVNQRPMRGRRGIYRVAMRHGVSRIRSGRRFTLGIIFHDAK
jgi:uncharacterized protein